jgi:predicted Zn finger-like uncharacterized protein
MLIVCPNCSTSYDVKAEALGESGRAVRCARCQKTWTATASDASPPAPKAAVAAAAPVPALATAKSGDADGFAAVPPADEDDWSATPAAPSAVAAPDGAAPKPTDDTDDIWGVPEHQSPPLAPGEEGADAPRRPLLDIESLAALNAQAPRGRFDYFDLKMVLQTICVLEFLLLGAIVIWRYELVRWQHQLAPLFSSFGLPLNLRGLQFVDVHTSKDVHDGVVVLIVDGGVKNVTNGPVSVPRLRFALRNKNLAELYAWTAPPDRGVLGIGETLPFRTRLASPPPDGNDILLRFMIRQDFVNGGR